MKFRLGISSKWERFDSAIIITTTLSIVDVLALAPLSDSILRILRIHDFPVILTQGINYIWKVPGGGGPPTPSMTYLRWEGHEGKKTGTGLVQDWQNNKKAVKPK